MGVNSGRQRQHRTMTTQWQHSMAAQQETVVGDDDSTEQRWEYNSKAMAAQQEVMAMQETELSEVMRAPGHGLNI